MTASSPSLHRFAQSDAVLRCLREAGLSPTVVYSAYHALDGFALGYAMQRLDFSYGDKELQRMVKDFLSDFPTDRYPDFTEHVFQHIDPEFGASDSFEFGLDLILDGLERLSTTPDCPESRATRSGDGVTEPVDVGLLVESGGAARSNAPRAGCALLAPNGRGRYRCAGEPRAP